MSLGQEKDKIDDEDEDDGDDIKKTVNQKLIDR